MCDRKGTPRIIGWSRPIVHIDGAVWCVAVGSSYPGSAQATKGVGVHALKGIVSWVKNVKLATTFRRRIKLQLEIAELFNDSLRS